MNSGSLAAKQSWVGAGRERWFRDRVPMGDGFEPVCCLLRGTSQGKESRHTEKEDQWGTSAGWATSRERLVPLKEDPKGVVL
jgi:hypothetical protein